jgi:hypothetical protein
MKIGDLVEMCSLPLANQNEPSNYYGMGLVDKIIDSDHYSVDWIILPWAEVRYISYISKALLREIK